MAAPTRLAALLVALPLALGACGQTEKDSAKDFTGDQKAVAQTVEDLQKASRKNDEAKICNDLLAPALVAKIKTASKGTCEQALKDALQDADSYELQVKKVAIEGTSATATVTSDTGPKDRTDTLALAKVGGAWKIAELGSAATS
ncbi:MAG TPA: nuclear transport factor 2 family protein [Baekduia sp.]|nr:nuclear transport factor 2 family protein [Baekduia sp.]